MCTNFKADIDKIMVIIYNEAVIKAYLYLSNGSESNFGIKRSLAKINVFCLMFSSILSSRQFLTVV